MGHLIVYYLLGVRQYAMCLAQDIQWGGKIDIVLSPVELRIWGRDICELVIAQINGLQHKLRQVLQIK